MRTTARETRDAHLEIAIAHQVVTMIVETPAISAEALREETMGLAELMAEPTAIPSHQIGTTSGARFHEKILEISPVVIHHEHPELC